MGVSPEVARRVEHDLYHSVISQGSQDVSPEGAPQRIVRPTVELIAGRVLVCAHAGIPSIRKNKADPFSEVR
jgi:hypothetical protein